MWPATIVQQLYPLLPDEYVAEPRVHLGTNFEIDVCAYEDDRSKGASPSPAESADRIAAKPWTAPQPTLTVESDFPEQYEYEVLVYDQSRGRQLVAAVELVSPANKDRPESRRAFVAKCAALLQQRVCISIVDLVTTRDFNLYADLMALVGGFDSDLAALQAATYAVTSRGRKIGQTSRLESWAYPLALGAPLPTLPLWLTADLAISLDLEASYEETCRVLRIA